MAHFVGLPKLSRRLHSTVPIDTATAAIARPGVFCPDQGQSDVENTAGAVVAFAGVDGSYGVYDVVDGLDEVVGAEVVIHSPEAEKAFSSFLGQELGWRPDVEFWGRCGGGALSEDENALYDRYLELVSTYSYFVEGAVVEHDPSGAASLVAEIPVPDGVLEAGDPFCEMHRVNDFLTEVKPLRQVFEPVPEPHGVVSSQYATGSSHAGQQPRCRRRCRTGCSQGTFARRGNEPGTRGRRRR